ncbi:hypothetical protein GCM10009525_18820 [Streptosporangium amethystogenes subsp. fukuiense]
MASVGTSILEDSDVPARALRRVPIHRRALPARPQEPTMDSEIQLISDGDGLAVIGWNSSHGAPTI